MEQQTSGVTLAEVAKVNEMTNFKPLEQLEKEHILKALELTGGNKTAAAKILGITLKTVYNKLAKYNGTIVSGN